MQQRQLMISTIDGLPGNLSMLNYLQLQTSERLLVDYMRPALVLGAVFAILCTLNKYLSS